MVGGGGLVGRGGLVSRGRLVSGSGLVGSRLVGLGLVLRVGGLALVLDIGNVAVVVVSGVGHGLDTAIGKVDLVGARDGLAVSGLLGVELGAGVVIRDSVLVSVGLGGLVILGLRVVGSRGGVVGGGVGSKGGGHEGGKNNEGNHDVLFELLVKELMLLSLSSSPL